VLDKFRYPRTKRRLILVEGAAPAEKNLRQKRTSLHCCPPEACLSLLPANINRGGVIAPDRRTHVWFWTEDER